MEDTKKRLEAEKKILYRGAPAPNIIVVTRQISNFWEFFPKYWPPQILNLLSSFKWVYFFPFF